MRINFKVFDLNSSSMDALYKFAYEGKSADRAVSEMWCPEAKAEMRKLRRLPVKEARRRAKISFRSYHNAAGLPKFR